MNTLPLRYRIMRNVAYVLLIIAGILLGADRVEFTNDKDAGQPKN